MLLIFSSHLGNSPGRYHLHVLLVKHGKVYKNEVKALRATVRALEAMDEPKVKTECHPKVKPRT